jgi:hypothetical protein
MAKGWRGRGLAGIMIGAMLGLGCAATDSGGPECSAGADCASGACHDGRCLPATGGSAGAGGSAGEAGAGAGGAGAAAGAGGGGAVSGSGGGFCQPNQDGTITREEVPLQAGLKANFRVAQNASVDTLGVKNADGSRSWDLSGPLAGDHLQLVETQPLAGSWFASKFPGASYAARLSDSQSLLGVFEITSAALLLKGVVSPEDGLQKTELVYDPAVTVLAFPLEEGKTWQTTSTVSGFAQGVLASYTEKYDYAVDAHGELKTPFGSFQVLRTRVVLTRTIGLITTTLRTFLFSAECFGTVASIVSQDNEPNTEFSKASELRRLAP